ncbi:uncharacterized protein LACBIDRAFT_315285 [Laccaria bicolor S238N-H82]|uniref:Predicted protein n=1 Tax=Laccaria bicolor (strain S238N-H82 / ATCC MYA-4686) TaxID=486041 RepID=B0E090_LACBS|nr:uncharacterized protein LACBIDRAFT_315285 [Laccaria bicolor S238N-H82]EDQ99743.1 predicted protein [Laccaria bicolor S238N-H82]|eukprot:XP_001889579.1 predicted protein [Laccaria bicolor S238N-H82]
MRAAGSAEIDKDEQEIGDSEKGRSYLEDKLLLIPQNAPLTLGALAMALCQIAALPGVALPAINTVCAVTFLLRDVELGAVAEDIRDIAITQFTELTSDLREFTEGLRVKVMEELEKKMEVLTEKTVELAEVVEKVTQQAGNTASSPYRDALIRATSGAPLNANPRLAAKESIRQGQSLVNLPRESRLRDCTNLVLVGKFSEAMGRATALQHKVRSALKLQNGGILIEMATDEGVAWLATKPNAESFLRELGETEASFKTRSYNIIAYYVPLNLDTNSEKDRREIKEANNFPKGAIMKLRWIKPPARRRTDQRFAHVFVTFSDADSANWAIVNGLSICNKRVSAAKSRKEPIRCLKCQGWDHIAAECVVSRDVNICGTCGARDHWTSKCEQQGTVFCTSCKTDDHTSWDHNCPTFLQKIEDLNARDPANDLSFFPARESWTWVPFYPLHSQRVPPAEIQVNDAQAGSQKTRYRQTQLGFEPTVPGGRPYTRAPRARQHSKTPVAESLPPIFPNPESPFAPPPMSEPPESSITRLQILQINLNKSSKVHLELYNKLSRKDWDIILVQEPHVTAMGNIRTPNGYVMVAPVDRYKDGAPATKAVTWVSSDLATNSWKILNVPGTNNITTIQLAGIYG